MEIKTNSIPFFLLLITLGVSVFFDSDLRWCNMHGFDVKGCNSDPEILGDEDEPTK